MINKNNLIKAISVAVENFKESAEINLVEIANVGICSFDSLSDAQSELDYIESCLDLLDYIAVEFSTAKICKANFARTIEKFWVEKTNELKEKMQFIKNDTTPNDLAKDLNDIFNNSDELKDNKDEYIKEIVKLVFE